MKLKEENIRNDFIELDQDIWKRYEFLLDDLKQLASAKKISLTADHIKQL